MKVLYVIQKLYKTISNYSVTDEDENSVYNVEEILKPLEKRIDVKDTEGGHVFSIERENLAILPKLNVRFSDGNKISLERKYRFLPNKIDILPLNMKIKIEGDILNSDFNIIKDSETIGHIEKSIHSNVDVFKISVMDEKYEPLVLAVQMAIESVTKDERY